ncbi:AAA family ATPase [bacterium]|nr:AAA family ATPase [bacterium]
MIVGVTGFFCAGKDTFAEFVMRKGFKHVSLSDMIREEIQARGEEITIERLTATGNELRAKFGPQVLAQRAIAALPRYGNAVVTSIRHSAEVEMLHTRRDFVMTFIDAPMEVRYQRSIQRGRAGDAPTFEAFKAAEEAQMRSNDPNSQQLQACKDMADILIDNDGDVEHYEEEIRAALRRIFLELAPPRPTWDEYFMNIAAVTATRGNCIKRHIGAIITVNKQIVSTGYNGTPKGITNCNEGGCPRCLSFADSGTKLDECLCVHAEENAIVQAACNGISIQGGTLYTTFCPCSYCAKSIINAGLVEVVYLEPYAMDDVTRSLFKQAGLKFRSLEEAK